MIKLRVRQDPLLEKNLKKELREKLSLVAETITKELEEVTPKDTGLASESWEISELEDTIEIKNKQEYVKYLNAGSSSQAPKQFIEQTVLKYGKPKGNTVTYK